MSTTPIFDGLAQYYRFDPFLGWAFEDGPCPQHQWDYENGPCACPRPWSDAWMTLCDALRVTDPMWDPSHRALEVVKTSLRRTRNGDH